MLSAIVLFTKLSFHIWVCKVNLRLIFDRILSSFIAYKHLGGGILNGVKFWDEPFILHLAWKQWSIGFCFSFHFFSFNVFLSALWEMFLLLFHYSLSIFKCRCFFLYFPVLLYYVLVPYPLLSLRLICMIFTSYLQLHMMD